MLHVHWGAITFVHHPSLSHSYVGKLPYILPFIGCEDYGGGGGELKWCMCIEYFFKSHHAFRYSLLLATHYLEISLFLLRLIFLLEKIRFQ